MIRAAATLLLAAIAAGASAAPAPRRLPPIDQCSADRGFAAFRAQLKQVIAAKDVKRLLAILSGDVIVDFGGGVGHKDFIAAWDLGRPATSKFWREATTVLGLGCIRIGGNFAAPSFAWQLGEGDDSFGLMVARPGALLKAAPSDTAPTVLRLDWHVVTVGDLIDGTPWAAATLSDGRRGFVHETGLRSPHDYHFTFEKKGGRWMVTAFVAGD